MDDVTARATARPSAAPNHDAAWGLLLLLMAMTAIGPTTLNIVVPALPEMANRLATDVATLQLTVSVYLLALAAAQLADGAAVRPLRPAAGAARGACADRGARACSRS